MQVSWQILIFTLVNELILKVHYRLIFSKGSNVTITQKNKNTKTTIKSHSDNTVLCVISFKREIYFKNSGTVLIICFLPFLLMVLWEQGSLKTQGKVQQESQGDIHFFRKRWVLCNFLLSGNLQCLSLKENGMIWRLWDLVKKSPWLLTGIGSEAVLWFLAHNPVFERQCLGFSCCVGFLYWWMESE